MSTSYWRLSGFYLFYFATLGAFLPFWNLYLQHLGLDAVQMGNLSGVLVGTRIVAPNFWGWIGDRSGKCLRLIRIVLFFSALLYAGFFFGNDFVWLAACTLSFGLFWNAALPLFEAVTLAHLHDDAHRYSQIRLWGSVGFVVSVVGLGWWFDRSSITQLPTFIVTLLVCNWMMTLSVPPVSVRHAHEGGDGVGAVLKRPEVIAFLIVSMLLQAAHGPYYVFYSVYLQQLHYSPVMIGSLWALGVLAEIVLFLFMRPLLARFSLRSILLCSLFCATVRWLVIAWCPNQLTLLAEAQVLHAASFGAAHVAAIHLVQDYFGTQNSGKGQALYSSFSFGLGGMFGSLGSGYYWDSLGAPVIFSVASLLSLVALTIAAFCIGRSDGENMPATLQ